MTHTPFDDLDAFDRRWSDSSRMRALADADPLLFVADHVMSVDRREGTVALHIATEHGPPTLLVIPDGPPDPRDRDCAVLLSNVVSGTPEAVSALGLVHHRLGGPNVSDLDRRWAEALKAVSCAHGFEPIGVIARLYDGSLVRVPVPESCPRTTPTASPSTRADTPCQGPVCAVGMSRTNINLDNMRDSRVP